MHLLIRIAEAAEQLRVSRSGIYRLIRSGQLHAVKIGRSRRLPWAAVQALAVAGARVLPA